MQEKGPDTHLPFVRNEMSVSGWSQASQLDVRKDVRGAAGLGVRPALSGSGQVPTRSL